LHLPAGATLASHPANELFVHLEVQIDRPSLRNLVPLVADGVAPAPGDSSDDLAAVHERLVARWLAYLPTLPGTRFSAVVAPAGWPGPSDAWLRPTHTGGWCRFRGVTAEEQLTVVVAGIALSLPTPLWSLLAAELAGPPVPLAKIATDAATRRLAELVVDAGLCEVLRTPDDGATWDREEVDVVGAP
jgi:hypothetical protein